MGSADNAAVIAMRDDGEYNRHSDFQLRLLTYGIQLIKDSPEPSETADGKPVLTIGDYGCSQGLNSAILMQEILSKQPPRTGARIFLVDTPYNDWSSVSQTFHARKPDISADGTRRIFTEMIPGSFFEQCLPDASVDIATAWSSLHWLSENTPHPEGTSVEDILKGWDAHTADLAHRDLVRFLTSRAREVRRNGIFVAGLSYEGDREVEISAWDRPGAAVSALLAREQLIAEGRLPKEVATVVVPIHARTRKEMEAALEVVKEFWEVEEMVMHEEVHPAYDQLQAELKAGRGEEAYWEYSRKVCTWWHAACGMLLIKAKMSTAKETAEEKKLLEDFAERSARVHYEKMRGRPEKIAFWYLRLRRK